MKHFTKLLVVVLCLLVFATTALANSVKPERNQVDIMKDVLKHAEGVKESLTKADPGEETQEKEEKIIESLDEIIEMIIEAQAASSGSSSSSGSPTDSESGNAGGTNPSPTPGGTGNPSGLKPAKLTTPPPRSKNDDWNPRLPGKDFESVAPGDRSKLPPGYERLIQRYRDVLARESSRIRR